MIVNGMFLLLTVCHRVELHGNIGEVHEAYTAIFVIHIPL